MQRIQQLLHERHILRLLRTERIEPRLVGTRGVKPTLDADTRQHVGKCKSAAAHADRSHDAHRIGVDRDPPHTRASSRPTRPPRGSPHAAEPSARRRGGGPGPRSGRTAPASRPGFRCRGSPAGRVRSGMHDRSTAPWSPCSPPRPRRDQAMHLDHIDARPAPRQQTERHVSSDPMGPWQDGGGCAIHNT